LKNKKIQSHDKYQQIIWDIAWLNMTIYNNSVLFLVGRQIELALLQLTQQVDEMLVAVQNILLGILPISIANPKILQNILCNISLCLPKYYDLDVGARFKNSYSYYDLIRVAIVGSLHNVTLIMYVPKKTANQHFTVYRINGLPNRIGKFKFILYEIDFPYFVIGSSQRD
jgi:hypothetical protein